MPTNFVRWSDATVSRLRGQMSTIDTVVCDKPASTGATIGSAAHC